MDVKNAVEVAKSYIHEAFGAEDIGSIDLDEVSVAEAGGRRTWSVGVSFSRPIDRHIRDSFPSWASVPSHRTVRKIVTVDDQSGQATAIRSPLRDER